MSRRPLRSLQRLGIHDAALLDLLLEPLRAVEAQTLGVRAAVGQVASLPPERVLAVLARHKLTLVWHDAVRAAGLAEVLAPELARALAGADKLGLARSMLAERALRRVGQVLDDAGVAWVTFKGAHLARVIYREPHLRLADDVDVMIAPADRPRALEALSAAGFASSTRGVNATHEVPVEGMDASIDLHTALFRPGRARFELGGMVLAERHEQDGLWVPSDAAASLVLMVHPAITEHVTGPLARVVDLDRWLRQRNREAVLRALDVVGEAGLEPAAWATLYWTGLWMGTTAVPSLAAQLDVSAARKLYLASWMALDPFQTYPRHSTVVRGAFSLALHSRLGDAVRAASIRLRQAREQRRD